jgi:5-methylthioadenosine/S-adenosylhomocysteine deaminase
MTSFLVRAGHIITSAEGRLPAVIENGAVLVTDGLIAAVGPYAELRADHTDVAVYGDEYGILTPGLVNTHGHFSEGLITGMAEQYTLWEWLHALINRVDPHLDAEMAEVGTLMAGVQMLHSGITTANDMFCSDPGREAPLTPGVVKAMDDLGLRGVLSFGAGDQGSTGSIEAQFAEHEALREAVAASARCTFRLGVGAVGGQSDEMFARSVEYATSHAVGVHIHLQEVREEVTATLQRRGLTPVGMCAADGLFDAPTIAAHCVWVDRHDRETMAAHQVGVAHNPVSNMILASGVAPITEFRALGVDVGIGVDGPASNDSQDMLQAVKATSLLARVHHQQAAAMSAAEAFEMATIGGARALRMADQIGSLEVGKKADLVLFDGATPALACVHDPIQAVVNIAGPKEIAAVWVDGHQLVDRGRVTSVDVTDVVRRARPLADKLVALADLTHLSVRR